MSLILGIDCSNGNMCVALVQGEEVLCEHKEYPIREVAESLSTLVQNALYDNHLKASELTQIVSVTGPGGFSGVRTGTAFLMGFVAVTKTPIKTLSSLEALALSVPFVQAGDMIVPVLDAKRESLYSSIFDADMQNIVDDQAVAIKDLPEYCKPLQNAKTIHVMGHGQTYLKDVLQGMNVIYHGETSDAVLFSQRAMLIQKKRLHFPIYLRHADASLPKNPFKVDYRL